MAYRFNENTIITDVTQFDAKGLGRASIQRENKRGRVRKQHVTIPYTIPGEKVKATLVPPYRKQIAQLDEIIEPHPGRIEPQCQHFGRCGGCSWQYMSYETQLKEKTIQVQRLLEEMEFDSSVVHPTIETESAWHYRNKMEFTFNKDGKLGLHEKGNFRKIIPLKTCLITSREMATVSMDIAKWAEKHRLSGYNKETKEGLLRHLMVRQSQATGEMMLALFATERLGNSHRALSDLTQQIKDKYPYVKSLLWLVNHDIADKVQAQEMHVLYGRDFIYDELGGYRYRLWYDTFFQTNAKQAEKLVNLAIEMAQPKETDKMIDLFCGVGTFSLPFATRVSQLVGIEIVEASIQSAKRNALDNGVSNTLFIAQDARQGLRSVLEKFENPDLLLLDPPRSGAGGKVMRRIARSKPKRIVYVSCNPKTFATDIKELVPFGYQLEVVQPVDLFPQTYHVECVSLLQRETI
ncbi:MULTISPECIES: 23S rRNA (uracil(1939)-C(5))-methyltransferase RlmD [Clostridia]|uniref:23S rRNA (uracil(1939)-C(5))-methyltransferase RlmD n=1 Tax=Clostridia TaxID=186801 RepID=UPI000EA216F7|nr:MULTISPECIES: 23S rRNA (uracil(1939)-C(5))-methyltransferase RlmD [Clostridia]NBJ70340.1 23S rRNA (uracil(1939)-C(5))-methyltransferase RlmD [Roseburia sp. 1XD42-34]RKI76337.1 23S rRNA (uracil(1939)-C(5))-methyltransferase RlmD [Clostridium sp. 1xD42-85]